MRNRDVAGKAVEGVRTGVAGRRHETPRQARWRGRGGALRGGVSLTICKHLWLRCPLPAAFVEKNKKNIRKNNIILMDPDDGGG